MAKENRPLRACDVCGQIDDHPRHSFISGPDDPLPVVHDDFLEAVLANEDMTPKERRAAYEVLNDRAWQMRHMDCCRAEGCPTGDCDRLPDGPTGNALLAIIQKEGPSS